MLHPIILILFYYSNAMNIKIIIIISNAKKSIKDIRNVKEYKGK